MATELINFMPQQTAMYVHDIICLLMQSFLFPEIIMLVLPCQKIRKNKKNDNKLGLGDFTNIHIMVMLGRLAIYENFLQDEINVNMQVKFSCEMSQSPLLKCCVTKIQI